MRRRTFLKTTAGVIGYAGLFRGISGAESDSTFDAAERVYLGPKRIPATRLFLGTGSSGWNHRSNQTRKLGVGGLANFLESAFENGVTSWDSADMYGSHPHLAAALKNGVPRKDVTILTKSTARTPREMRKDIERFCQELGTDTIDIFLLHCLEDPNWRTNLKPVMDVVDEFQERGVIRSKGVSCHSLAALKAAAEEPWVEIDLARINPHGNVMDADPETVIAILRDMKAAGKGVIGMKVFGAGQLVDKMDECMRYVLNLDCVDAVTIGCESIQQRDEVVSLINRTPRIA